MLRIVSLLSPPAGALHFPGSLRFEQGAIQPLYPSLIASWHVLTRGLNKDPVIPLLPTLDAAAADCASPTPSSIPASPLYPLPLFFPRPVTDIT